MFWDRWPEFASSFAQMLLGALVSCAWSYLTFPMSQRGAGLAYVGLLLAGLMGLGIGALAVARPDALPPTGRRRDPVACLVARLVGVQAPPAGAESAPTRRTWNAAGLLAGGALLVVAWRVLLDD